MLVTSKAGSEGISLVHAVDCMLVSPMWNPSIEEQSLSRSDRKGQLYRVTCYRFFSEHSIERRIRETQRKKRIRVEKVLSDRLILEHAHTINMADNTDYLNIVRIRDEGLECANADFVDSLGLTGARLR